MDKILDTEYYQNILSIRNKTNVKLHNSLVRTKQKADTLRDLINANPLLSIYLVYYVLIKSKID